MIELTPAQARAIAFVAARAERSRAEAMAELARAGVTAVDDVEPARVTLNFHPDRLRPSDGISVVDGLLADGRYASQYVTGVTNGSPTAHAGGSRDGWEHALFGDAYRDAEVMPADRPKYGALNLLGHADGGSPRFGSCYLELQPHVLSRCTMTWGDSHEGPEHVGTAGVFAPLLAALVRTCETSGRALGVEGAGVAGLLQRWRAPLPATQGRALDEYIEVQVHGEIDLGRDVAAVVMDPSFAGTETHAKLAALAAKHRHQLRRHPGFVLAPRDVPADFRGPRMPALAERVARTFARDVLDADVLGRAAASLHRTPEAWTDWDAPRETWQHLKQLWHVLVAFGN